MHGKIGIAVVAIGGVLAATAYADDVLYPTVVPPQQVAQAFLSARTVLTFPAEVAADGKTAVVMGAIPSGGLTKCTVTLIRSETDPAKMDGVQWRVATLACPAE
ncbi:MAG: hypothetical protein ABSC06_23500 [Rhodopila sp.]|jgi:hypothetical protein